MSFAICSIVKEFFMDKYVMQNSQYLFPYHHVPHIENGIPYIFREYKHGIEYLSYISYVAQKINQLNPGSICDIGCGDGKMSLFMDGNNYTGLDISEEAIKWARSFNSKAKFINKSHTELNTSFDCITLIEVLEHIPTEHLKRFYEGITKIVKPKGKVIVTVPSKNIALVKKHFRHYHMDDLIQYFNEDFVLLEKDYLITNNIATKIINKVLSNRLFLLKHKGTLAKIWSIYKNKYLISNTISGKRVFAIFEKRA